MRFVSCSSQSQHPLIFLETLPVKYTAFNIFYFHSVTLRFTIRRLSTPSLSVNTFFRLRVFFICYSHNIFYHFCFCLLSSRDQHNRVSVQLFPSIYILIWHFNSNMHCPDLSLKYIVFPDGRLSFSKRQTLFLENGVAPRLLIKSRKICFIT